MISLRYFFRRFRNDRIYSVISIVGLTIGMTTTFLIALYIINELEYDRHHKNANKIFRIISENTVHHFTEFNSPFLMPPAAKESIPGILDYCRTFSLYSSRVKKEQTWIPAEGIYSTDNQVFDLFTFHLLSGKISGKIEPGDIYVSESFARKFVPGTNAVDKSVIINIKGEEFVFTVKAVYADYPFNSVFRPEALVSMEIGHRLLTRYLTIIGDSSFINNFTDSWANNFYQNFLLLNKESKSPFISAQVDSLASRHLGKEKESNYRLQKLTDAYLHSDDIIGGSEVKGSFTHVMIFLIVSILVLLASGMNYVLLFTSRAMARIKELGVRRVMGAGKISIIQLLTSESIYTSVFALPLAIMFTELLLPYENKIMQTNIAIHYLQNFWYLLFIFLIPLLLGVLSGLFVSFQAYRYSSAEVIKNPLQWKSGLQVKKFLIIFQLVIFISLISAVLIIRNQVNLLLKSDPGFETNNLIILPFPDDAFANHYESFKSELSAIPGIVKVSGAMFTPPSLNVMGMQFKNPSMPGGKMTLEFLIVDYDFIETMGMKMVSGRSFLRDYPSDEEGIVLTQSAAIELNLKEAVGTKLPFGKVIGVVKDIQLHSLQQEKKPAYLSLNPKASKEILIRVNKGSIREVIAAVRKKMQTVTGSSEFRYNLYTDKLKELYRTEIRLGTIISLFSIVALLLACLGLFGLASLITEQRTKEIGIRKVNGARTGELMLMLSWNISRWVLLSVLIAVFPVWFFLNKWLEHYAYHIRISSWIFIQSALIAILIALLTTIWHGYKCASQNPVEALKYE